MKTLISCAYTMDNCCVELKFRDGRMIAMDTIAVENEVADNMYQRSELDYLIYNDPIGYADLVLILSILVDAFISKISFPMQPGPEIGSISDA